MARETLQRWDPFSELAEMSTRLNRMFGGREGDGGRELAAYGGAWIPATDVVETEKGYEIHMEVPQVKKEDIHVSVEEHRLIVRGERKSERQEEEGKKFRRVERSYGEFVRRFDLPVDTQPENIEARFEDGMLYITIPRSEEVEKSHEITIH